MNAKYGAGGVLVELELEKGEILRVVGPARVDVLSGSLLAVGAVYRKGESFVVHSLRSYGIKALEDAKIRAMLGEGASVEEPSEGEEVIDDWVNVAKSIHEDPRKIKKVIIIGPVESGKTTLTAFIANYMMERGSKVCVIEGDVGQEDLAVPGTLSLALPSRKFLWLRELKCERVRFVGCISPSHAQCQLHLLAALRELIEEAENLKCDTTVVNTDGWVSSKQALDFKVSIIRWLRPTHVITLSNDIYNTMRAVLGHNSFTVVLKARSPVKVKERSRDERRRLRAEAYRKYFSKGSKTVNLRLGEVGLIGSCVLGGQRVSIDEAITLCPSLESVRGKVLFASLYGQYLNVVLSDGPHSITCRENEDQNYIINAVRRDDLSGYLVGILDEEGIDAALGIIEDVDFSNNVIKVRTPYSGKISALVVGRIKLSPDYEDTGRVLRCGI